MHVRALFLAIIGVCALGVAAWFSLRVTPDAEDGASTSISKGIPSSSGSVADSADDVDPVVANPNGAQATSRIAAGAVSGSFYVQVDEVDRCIDPIGTGLVLFDERDSIRYEARVDEGGAAVFEGVQVDATPRRFSLRTSVPDRGCFPMAIQLASSDFEGDPLRAGLSLSLIHLHNLELRAIDAVTRAPIEGASLQLDSFTAVAPVSTGADGRGVVNLSEPSGTLIATAPGYHEALWHYPEIREDGSTWLHDRAELEMQPDRVTSFLEVLVVDDKGAPVPGADVEVFELELGALPSDALASIPALQRMEYLSALSTEREGLGAIRGFSSDALPNLTDEAGIIRYRALVPCRLMFQVFANGARRLDWVEVEAGTLQEETIQLQAAATLEVLVRDLDGAPVRGAYVQAHMQPRGAGSFVTDRRSPVPTNETGMARIAGLEPRAGYRVRVSDEPLEGMFKNAVHYNSILMTPDSGGTRNVEVVVAPSVTGKLRCEVVDAVTGEPIFLWKCEGGRVERLMRDVQSWESLTWDTTLHFVPPDPVIISAPGYRSKVVEIEVGTEEIVIALSPLTRGYDTQLSVTAVSPDGSPVEFRANGMVGVVGADNTWVSEGAPLRTVLLDQEGPALIVKRKLIDGEVLWVNLECLSSRRGHGKLVAYRLQAGEQRAEKLVLGPDGELRGTVVFADGIPAGGVTVSYGNRFVEESAGGAVVKDVWTDDRGEFRVALSEGEYWLQADAALHTARRRVVVESGASRHVVLVLAPSREVTIRLLDSATDEQLSTVGPISLGGEARELRVGVRGYQSRVVLLDDETPTVQDVRLPRVR